MDESTGYRRPMSNFAACDRDQGHSHDRSDCSHPRARYQPYRLYRRSPLFLGSPFPARLVTFSPLSRTFTVTASMLLSRSIRLPRTPLRSLSPLRPSRFFSNSRPRFIIDMGTVDTTDRLSQLRQLMKEHKVDVYSMPSHSLSQSGSVYILQRTLLIAFLKSFPRKIATSPSTLRPATAAEVSDHQPLRSLQSDDSLLL